MKFRNLLSISLIALAIVSLISSCSKAEPKEVPTTFSGTILNAELDTIYLYNDEATIKLAVDSGKFSDTIDIQEGYYTIEIGRESSAMYWDKGFQLDLEIDVKEFDESIEYGGIGAGENNALAKSYMMEEEHIGSSKDFYSQSEDQFLSSIDTLRNNLHAILEGPHLKESFAEEQKKNADFLYNRMIYSYEGAHKYYMGLDSLQLSDEFYKAVIPFKMDDEKTFDRSAAYQALLSSYVQYESSKLNKEGKSDLEALIVISKDLPNEKIKNSVLNTYSRYLLKPNEDLDDAYAFLRMNVTDTALIASYEKTFEIQKKLKKGNASPIFTKYENHTGDSTSLSDLKGKYAYFDIWATWCGPCIREIPSLKEVEAKYHNKNIQFISISVDSRDDHPTWVEMVKDKELGGIQLFAHDSWKSDFIRAYNINSIPRFILVDPMGNIVNADAPRPSDPKLIELFDELNI